MTEIGRRFGYEPGTDEPFLALYRKFDPDGPSVAIRQSEAWMFSEEHNPFFIQQMEHFVDWMLKKLKMKVHTSQQTKVQRMGSIAQIVQEGLDELIEMPPKPKASDHNIVVGEGVMTVGSEKHTVELTKGMLNHGSL